MEIVAKFRFTPQFAFLDRVLQGEFCSGEQNREFGPGHAGPILCTAQQILIGRKSFDHTVKPPGAFEDFDYPHIARHRHGAVIFHE